MTQFMSLVQVGDRIGVTGSQLLRHLDEMCDRQKRVLANVVEASSADGDVLVVRGPSGRLTIDDWASVMEAFE